LNKAGIFTLSYQKSLNTVFDTVLVVCYIQDTLRSRKNFAQIDNGLWLLIRNHRWYMHNFYIACCVPPVVHAYICNLYLFVRLLFRTLNKKSIFVHKLRLCLKCSRFYSICSWFAGKISEKNSVLDKLKLLQKKAFLYMTHRLPPKDKLQQKSYACRS